MRTFSIQTLGCKVNQYESEQIAALLSRRGLVQVDSPAAADLRIVNTCSVTIQAASKSRQTVRRTTRLPVLPAPGTPTEDRNAGFRSQTTGRTIVTGCWATSDRAAASQLPHVDAFITHHDDVAAELERLLDQWNRASHRPGVCPTDPPLIARPEPLRDDGLMIEAGSPAAYVTEHDKPASWEAVKRIPRNSTIGTIRLPLLGERQPGRQRAFLKIQDGCDAHCSYCIIPQLRPTLWSKPVEDAVDEAQRLVDAGHIEIVLTGIFLGAYGQPTARRRHQARGDGCPFGQLVDALCTRVAGLRRLRFSSLEPGDLTDDLICNLKSHPQVVPHFHLPLQSGSDAILRRMNRQYSRDDFLRMIDRVRGDLDRPAITTDIIVGFPGETEDDFARTLDVVERAKFIHIHAFGFSPRPRTAAARWTRDFVRGPLVNDRIERLNERSRAHSLDFRRQFAGEMVEILVEQCDPLETTRHGRCERYFDVKVDNGTLVPGESARVRIDRISDEETWGSLA